MTWLSVLELVLQLCVFVSRKAEEKQIEDNLTNALQTLQNKRVKAASDARDDVTSGRVPSDPNDPNRRD